MGRKGFGLLLGLVFANGLDAQIPRAFPDEKSFFAATQENLARSQREQFRFAYKERRTELHMNPFGRIGTGATRAYEITPKHDGAVILRRLVESDGKPVSNSPVDRSEPREKPDRPARRSSVDDTVAVLNFAVDRRESVRGRDVIVVRFSPRPNGRPETREGRLAKAFEGSIWVDEAACEVIRVEATAMDNISYGFGMLARLGKGATVTLTRDQIEDQVWLPTSVRFVGRGRALIFRKLNVDHVIEWFDYQRVPSS